MNSPPEGYLELLQRPNFAHLATVRPDGGPQTNVMWFAWDGEVIRFTHTSNRQKFRNIAHEPRVALSIVDRDNPYKFLEVRGKVISIEPDTGAEFYRQLQVRYGVNSGIIREADSRVVITVEPSAFVPVDTTQVVSGQSENPTAPRE
jgi:PPOX class probable F420-dependent enzyme